MRLSLAVGFDNIITFQLISIICVYHLYLDMNIVTIL